MTPLEWLLNGDTGISSKTILAAMTDTPYKEAHFPRDSDDLGRCYRLLKLFPHWRNRLPEVAARYPEWGPMIAAWDELELLYEDLLKDPDKVLWQTRETPASRAFWQRMKVVTQACWNVRHARGER